MSGEINKSAITGASGFLGQALLERLVPEEEVSALFRKQDERSASWARRGFRLVYGDLDDEGALRELVRGVRTVYHCAATFAKSDAKRSHRVNVVGTENVARAAAAAGVHRFVYVSSISVYAATRRPGNVLTEQIEPENTKRLNNYSATKYLGELSVRRFKLEQGLPYTIIRPTNIYGLRSGPWFRQWESTLRRLPFAIGDFVIDIVYIDDVIEVMIEAGRSPAAENEVFNIGHEMVKMNQFIQEVGRIVGRRVRVLPRGVDHVLRLAIDRLYLLATGTHMSMSMLRSVYYPHTKASEKFGYAPRIKLAEGFARIAKAYQVEAHREGPAGP